MNDQPSTPASDSPSAFERVLHDERLPEVLLWLTIAAGTALLLYLHRGIGYFGDDWNFALLRDGWSLETLLSQHNGHLVVIPLVVFKLVTAVFGVGTIWPFYLICTALHVSIVYLIFVWFRQRVDQWVALMAAVTVLFLGSGWENIFWSFQQSMLGSIAAGIGALIVFERDDSLRNRAVCSLLVAVSLACSGIGVIFAIGIASRMLWRADRLKSATVLLAPIAFYAVWYLAYGRDFEPQNVIKAAPSFTAELIAYAFAGTLGLSQVWGPVIAGFAVFGLFKVMVRDNGIRPQLLTLLALPLSFWALTASQRAGWSEAWPSRYVYVGVVFVFLAAAEAMRRQRLNRGAHLGLAGLLAFALAANVVGLSNGAATIRGISGATRAELTALSLAPSGSMPAGFDPSDPTLSALPLPPLMKSIAANPSGLTWSSAEIARQPDGSRSAIDQALLKILPPTVQAADRPKVDDRLGIEPLAASGELLDESQCKLIAAGEGASVDVPVTGSALFVESTGDTELFLRRFGAAFPEQKLQVLPVGGHSVAVAVDENPTPWIARIVAPAGATVCAVK